MPDTRDALEAALAANPDDAALHAAYADFLLEAGDPRGEYIRLQLELEKPDLPPTMRADLWQRQSELFRTHSRTWVGPLAGHPAGLVGHWRRGWIRSVRVPRYVPGVFQLLATAPITRLLHQLDLSGAHIGDEGVDELIASGLIARLHSLDLRQCDISDDGAEALARCPAVAKLESLSLDSNNLSPIGAAALAAIGFTDLGPQRFIPDDRTWNDRND
jgi:uncharacterized protein (TIGR02996 family)